MTARQRGRFAVAAALLGAAAAMAAGAVATLHGEGRAALAAVVALTAVTWGYRRRVHGTHVVVAVVVLLLLVPARFRIDPLGAAGTPASLLGFSCLGIWVVGVVAGLPRVFRQTPALRWALLGVVLTSMISYIAAGYRFHDELESRAADRGLLTIVSVLGLALLVAEVLPSRVAVHRVVAAIVASGSGVALLGITAFVLHVDLADKLHLPGFTLMPVVFDSSRGGFSRIISTTSHPIELAVVLVMLLPLALWLYFTATGGLRIWWGLCLALVAVAIPMTVSRTGVVGVVVVLLVVVPTWTWRRRLHLLLVGVAGLLVFRVLVPGLIGTLQGYLFDPGGDTSLLSRHAGRQRALDAISERPWFGRGFGTFLPERYGYIDNQALLGAVEVGLVGQLAYAALFAVSAGMAVRIRRAASGVHQDSDRSLAVSLAASLAVSVSTWLTYDALSFPTGRGLTFVVIGLLAALWRVVRAEVDPDGGIASDTDAIEASEPVRVS